MKRDLEWNERQEDGVKRYTRVKFPGNGQIKWQFKRADEEQWDYETLPTPEDWKALEEKVDALYHRRRAALRDWELVKKLRAEHG